MKSRGCELTGFQACAAARNGRLVPAGWLPHGFAHPPVRASSMSCCVCSAACCLMEISLDTALASDRIWMAVASSRMLPWSRGATREGGHAV